MQFGDTSEILGLRVGYLNRGPYERVLVGLRRLVFKTQPSPLTTRCSMDPPSTVLYTGGPPRRHTRSVTHVTTTSGDFPDPTDSEVEVFLTWTSVSFLETIGFQCPVVRDRCDRPMSHPGSFRKSSSVCGFWKSKKQGERHGPEIRRFSGMNVLNIVFGPLLNLRIHFHLRPN